MIRNLERIEHALGIEASELADGPEGLAELNQRLLTVTMARRQAVALMVSWSAEDGNTPIESFVESGILRTTPNALSADELSSMGLSDARPGALNEQEQAAALIALVNEGPEASEAALSALYRGLSTAPRGRDHSADLLELARLARTGRAVVERADSIVALRQERLTGRMTVSASELFRLRDYHGQSLNQLAARSDLSPHVRETVLKLMDHPDVVASLTRNGTNDSLLSRYQIHRLATRVSGFDYGEPDPRVLTESDLRTLERLFEHTGPLTEAQFDSILAGQAEVNGYLIRDSQRARLERLGGHEALRRLAFRNGQLNRWDLNAIRPRLNDFTNPVESMDGRLILSRFVDAQTMEGWVERLYEARGGLFGYGRDAQAMFEVLEPLDSDQRQMLIVEFASHLRSEGRDDVSAGEIFEWLDDELGGWRLGKAEHLLTRRNTPEVLAEHLLEGPAFVHGDDGTWFWESDDGRTHDLRTVEGRLAWERAYHSIYAGEPYGIDDMDDSGGIREWRAAARTAQHRLRDYERAVNGPRDAGYEARVEEARRRFAYASGEATALHHTLSASYSEQLQADIEFYEAARRYTQVGVVVVAATAVTIATAGAASAAGAGLVVAAGKGVFWGTVAGTAAGTMMRVGNELSNEGTWDITELDAENWQRIGAGSVEDFKMAAGTAFAAAIPTATFGRLAHLANASRSGASLTRLQAMAVGFTSSTPAVVHMACTGALTNTLGAFCMRGVHAGVNGAVEHIEHREDTPEWLAGTLAQVNTEASEDLAFSWQNLGIELVSGGVSGGLNRYLGFLDDAAHGGREASRGVTSNLGRAAQTTLRRGTAFSADMSLNLVDEMGRNIVYGRALDEGLVDALLIGAPGQVAGGMAARRFAAQQLTPDGSHEHGSTRVAEGDPYPAPSVRADADSAIRA
ncbi:MAG: hypothetical protein AAFY60_03980, partial [Myxococcota bacterium]